MVRHPIKVMHHLVEVIRITSEIVKDSEPRGSIVKYTGIDKRGTLSRVIIRRDTGKGTVEGLVRGMVEVGARV